MTPSTRELLVRASALYLPLTLSILAVVAQRPNRARQAGAICAFVWNLVALLALNSIAQQVGWWAFPTTRATVAGMPVDLWIGWAVLWGALPVLTTFRLEFVGVGLVIADLILMPLAAPAVVLQPSWIVGELVCVALALVPGLRLAAWTTAGARVAYRAVLQAVAFGGLLLFVLPSLIFTVSGDNWQVLVARPRWAFVAVGLIATPAAALALQAVREFAVVGQGTPVPLDPPQRLVVSGPYAFVANPMQLGATLILAIWGGFLGSPSVMVAAFMGAAFSTGVAAWNEENYLSSAFGSEWQSYRSAVRPWIPRWRPYLTTDARLFVATTCEPCSDVGRAISSLPIQRLTIEPAEGAPERLTRITYRSGAVHDTGLAAIGRSLEHANLAWATVGWVIRLPLVLPFLQLITDAVGGGPREIPSPQSVPR